MSSQKARRRLVAATQVENRRAMAAAEVADPLEVILQMLDAIRRALLQAQAGYRVIIRDSIDDSEQAAAAVELINVRRELELLEARRSNLINGAATLQPPRPELVAEAQERARALGQVLSDNAKVAAVAGLVADLVALSEKLTA